MNHIPMEKEINGDGYYVKLVIDPFNKRVRMDDHLGNITLCLKEADEAMLKIGAEKLIVKARQEYFKELILAGFVFEASIDKYFFGSDCCFFAKYYQNERRNSINWKEEDEILTRVLSLSSVEQRKQLPLGYTIRKANRADAEELARLYQRVFEIYPVPMNDPEYVKKCIENDAVFYVCLFKEKIVSAASAEVNSHYHNAEITDCATLPEHRQFGIMKHLICELEKYLAAQQIFCVYSIARALSYGINAAFYSLDYTYRGRLANNCYIFDKLEDMNIWVKNIL
ncbi:putative beta-lysine N-acetyltransferase [Peribacillus huizhouensis]|uniref:Beta-lysine N-acetyltransferase n=1 Tax=Peribacillus huizhouensis TaxID=1501239 RepID=A0ABR6CRW5_9BACI|nr:putative beta-lysine N-acetyltransferase [Peribacillus huizhouensis]MBA9027695.1 putative beta-lysine N-acetyltransferase [Peribacillus huizhouensis]